MGDYNFGVNSSVAALSPVDFQTNSCNTSLFFPSEPVAHTMQDDLLLDKSTGKQIQQLSPSNESTTNGDQNSDDYNLKNRKNEESETDEVQIEKKNLDSSSPGTTSSPLQLGFSESSNALNITSTAPSFWSTVGTDDTYVQGIPTMNNSLPFQNFATSTNPILSTNMGPQLNLTQQHTPQRRAITGAHNFPQNRHQPPQPNLFKAYTNWSTPHQTAWSTPQTPNTLSAWNAVNITNHKRSVPNMSPISPMKKTQTNVGQHSMVISPSKFRRSTSMPVGKPFPQGLGGNTNYDMTGDENRDGNVIMPFQDRQITSNLSSPLDNLRLPLEQQLMDIMRTTMDGQDHYKGFINYNSNNMQSLSHVPARSYGRRRGKSPFFTGLDENHLDDGHLEQMGPSLNSSMLCAPKSPNNDSGERFSRKVFVGGLPPDIDEDEINASFRRFGPLVVDWPHKAESKSYFPPKGYAFLLFQDEASVQALIDACIQEDDKLYLCVSSPTIKDKPVQIRPWRLSDADFVLDASMPLDPRKTVFVGGVPRPLKALELAMIMDRLYGGVCYAGIDTDPELKYPKGAGRVAFSNQQSYIAAISARFVQLQHGDIEKRVEVKPYVLDDQMCDECQGSRCGGKFAPFFCANVTCLQYYCEHCWAAIHSRPGREFHKPLVKEGADRPRAVPFRWC
ncbi:cytoplasmic polyadenylation element-binding protein 3 [Nephila pilipes]|uniref:Cytoplasmic polyadenylation element-binding protein 3 n=1 Tax=Nephila pilipes TaxID=299642 RepID=A0A8X6NQT9_NEPPI|nr:cytoplasmic polyadenylation element-binding protein 3 [Nephila pilipes]